MTQHNLQVPEEWVNAAWLPLPWDAAMTWEEVETVIQAILPKVRERLLEDEPIRALDRVHRQVAHYAPGTRGKEAMRQAFDSAFPPEDSP